LEERQLDCARLRIELDLTREDLVRQTARCRDRYETMRQGMQSHVSELEQELACSRAAAAAALRERDEVRKLIRA